MSQALEQRTLEVMIRLFCRRRHATKELCEPCSQLLAYARDRLDKCPFGNDKPTCKNCPIHCYSPEMREKIAEVMRFSGPRMLLHHPLLALRHLCRSLRKNPENKGGTPQ